MWILIVRIVICSKFISKFWQLWILGSPKTTGPAECCGSSKNTIFFDILCRDGLWPASLCFDDSFEEKIPVIFFADKYLFSGQENINLKNSITRKVTGAEALRFPGPASSFLPDFVTVDVTDTDWACWLTADVFVFWNNTNVFVFWNLKHKHRFDSDRGSTVHRLYAP